ncbi:MAG TPA: hypothetical protein VHA75_08710 [Rugosimonospora sp.]|nr:hypothetical protein [Rugosimonospora sp.]
MTDRTLPIVGYVNGRPVWLYSGADDPVVEPDDEPDGDEGDAPPADNWTPPTRDEWERLVAAKKKAADEAAVRRRWLQQHGIDHRTGRKAGDDDPEPAAQQPAASAPQVDPVARKREIDAAVAKAVAKTELRYKPALQATAVKTALDNSGVDPAFRGLIKAALDTTDLDYDDEGNGIGLDEQIAALKLEYPQAFAAKKTTPAPRRTTGAAEVDGGRKPAPPEKKLSWQDRINQQMGF